MLQGRIAAQLYTLRAQTGADFAGTVGKVAAIGYRSVELAGFGNLITARQVKEVLEQHALTCCSAHVPLEQFEERFSGVLTDAELIGNRLLVIPWLPPERRKVADDWRRLADSLNHFGRLCHDRGFQLAYHHHDFEFAPVEGHRPFDTIWQHTDPKLVKAELDVYWLAFAGEEPISWIRRLAERVTLLHLKDMAKGPDRRFAEVGTGVLDFSKVLDAADSVGVQWAIVEQDDTYGRPPLESLAISFENLKSFTTM